MTTPEAQRRRQHIALTVLIIGFSLITILLSIQVLGAQKREKEADQARDDAIYCQQVYAQQIGLWVNGTKARDGLIEVLVTARESNADVRSADQKWHKAVDAVFQLIVQAQALPEGEELAEEKVERVLARYQRARRALFEAYAAASYSATTNPFPPLRLECSP
jgi:hypothetical protein